MELHSQMAGASLAMSSGAAVVLVDTEGFPLATVPDPHSNTNFQLLALCQAPSISPVPTSCPPIPSLFCALYATGLPISGESAFVHQSGGGVSDDTHGVAARQDPGAGKGQAT